MQATRSSLTGRGFAHFFRRRSTRTALIDTRWCPSANRPSWEDRMRVCVCVCERERETWPASLGSKTFSFARHSTKCTAFGRHWSTKWANYGKVDVRLRVGVRLNLGPFRRASPYPAEGFFCFWLARSRIVFFPDYSKTYPQSNKTTVAQDVSLLVRVTWIWMSQLFQSRKNLGDRKEVEILIRICITANMWRKTSWRKKLEDH